MSRTLAEILLKDRIISPEQFSDAEKAAKAGKGYVRHLIDQKFIAENKLLFHLSQKFGLSSINLNKFEISQDVIKLVPPEFARKHQVIPIQSNKGVLVVACCDPTALQALEDLKFRLKLNVEAILTTHSAFDAAMQRYYTGVATAAAAIDRYQRTEGKDNEGALSIEIVQVHEIDNQSAEQNAPVIALVNGILTEGVRRGASDIHIEPYEHRVRARLRVDGSLIEVAEIPKEMKRAVTARFKIMSRMDIAESRVPQDGRIKLKMGGMEIDFRANSMPTLFGEKIVLRMLNKSGLQLDMLKLGFEEKQLEIFKKGIYSPNGMVLVTGPTGSGKTTTLYSGLAELNKTTDNISTAEDPVEYNLEGVNQVQVNKEIGLTFAAVLRSLLRQDPDIVLVGEIRDYETAEVATQAALTGHLVLSSLHTNDAPSAITRLVNMGLEPFLVVGSVNTIVAQRLIRTICLKCKAEAPTDRKALIKLGFSEAAAAQIKLYKGTGCSACNNTGFKGRLAVYEVLEFTNTLKELVVRGESVLELKRQAQKEGMKTLRMSALTKVAEGKTTLEEALSLTMEN